MRRFQQGFVLYDVLLGAGFWIALSTVILGLLSPMALKTYNAHTIKTTLMTLQKQSTDHYFKQVLTTRCHRARPLSISDFSPPLDDTLADYQVKYRLSHTVPYHAPLGIEFTVTLKNKDSINALMSLWPPERVTSMNQLVYYTPLNLDMPNSEYLNTNTGCIQ